MYCRCSEKTYDESRFRHRGEYMMQFFCLRQMCLGMARFRSSFYHNCLLLWDKIEPEIKQSCLLDVFKTQPLALIHLPSKWPTTVIIQLRFISSSTQLHDGLGKLNFHKLKHNFGDVLNPLCLIDDPSENPKHLLLFCPSYIKDRHIL